MRTKKTKTAKTAKKTTKVASTRKPKTGNIKLLSATGKAGTRRPPNNPDVPQTTIDLLNHTLNDLKATLDDYSQHLRALDRKRLNGVGVRKLGFIERAYEIALENTEFLPHYLTIERFGEDLQYFMEFRSLVDLTTQIREKLWNITIQSSDIAYTDALEFYAAVREAACQKTEGFLARSLRYAQTPHINSWSFAEGKTPKPSGVAGWQDAAETIFNELASFFHRGRAAAEDGETPPTEKQAKRDFNALLHGKHDGKLVIESVKPKLSGGKRKIIDKTFKDTAKYKETDEADFKE
jgi:hypothetical protein